MRATGLTEAEIRDRERVFEALVAKATRMSLRALTANISGMVTAAAAPQLSAQPDAPGPTLTWGEASVVTETWNTYADGELLDFLADVFRDSAAKAAASSDEILTASITQQLGSWLQTAVQRLKYIGVTIWKELAAQLTAGYAAGDTMQQLAARVRAVAEETRGRASNSARTEIAAAANAGSLIQMLDTFDLDDRVTKMWIATDDERTRPAHHLADNQEVPLHQPFIVGSEFADYPGDPNLSPGNRMNCRCTLGYSFAEDALTAAVTKTKGGKPKWKESLHPRGPDGEFIKKGTSATKTHKLDHKGVGLMSKENLEHFIEMFDGDDFAELTFEDKVALADAADKHGLMPKYNELAAKVPTGSVNTLDAQQKGLLTHIDNMQDLIADEKDPQQVKAYQQEIKDAEKQLAKLLKTSIAAKTAPKKPEPQAAPLPIMHNGKIGAPITPTKAIYKMSYGDGFVVAEKQDNMGFWKMTWNAKTKKFELFWRPVPQTGEKGADWFAQTPKWNKGEAYKELQKGGWLEPTGFTEPMNVTTPEVTASAPKTKLQKQLADIDLASPYEKDSFDELVIGLGPDGVKKLSQEDKDALYSKAVQYESMYPSVTEMKYPDVINDWNGSPLKGTQAPVSSPTTKPAILKPISQMSAEEFDQWFTENITPAMWNSMGSAEKDSIKAIAYWAIGQGVTAPAQKITLQYGDTLTLSSEDDDDFEFPDFTNMADEDSENWFDDLTKDQWDSLTVSQKDLVYTEAKYLDSVKSLSLPKLKIDDFKTQDLKSAAKKAPKKAVKKAAASVKIKMPAWWNLSTEQKKTWFDDLTKEQWDSFTAIEQDTIRVQASFLWNNDDIAEPSAKIFKFTNPTEKLPDFLANAVNPKPKMSAGKLEPVAGVPLVTKATKKTPLAHGNKMHLDTIARIHAPGDIGVPKTGQTDFKTVSPEKMVALQKQMLANAGKEWTAKDRDAVQRYTTSVGYRSTNAVLRNDQSQLKLFSDDILTTAGQHALDLQDTMLPLAQNVRLFRRVGAQAFGFSSMNVSSAELKKLEGATIQDKGFVSTTVVERPEVQFDYAMSKPIHIEIDAPEGTPAVSVSSATPSWSQENEVVLAAGTNFRIKSVRAATAADKQTHGNQIEHIVTMEVVPSKAAGLVPKAPDKPVATAAPPEKMSTVTAPLPKTPPIKAVPKKINTAVIYKTTYADKAVVAENFNASPPKRLIWNAKTKKFVLQQQSGSAGTWVNTNIYGKGEAYKKFSQEDGWHEPGSAVLDQSGNATPGDPANAPNVSGNPTGQSVTTAEKFTANTLQSQEAGLGWLNDSQMANIFNQVKQIVNGGGYITLNTPPDTIFKQLVAVQKANAGHMSQSSNPPLNLLQLLKVLDEQGAKKVGKENTSLYEAKITSWLQTAAGKSKAAEILNPVKPSTAGVKQPIEIGKPRTDVTTDDFKFFSSTEINAMQNEMFEQYGQWTQPQKDAIGSYTGAGFDSMNSYLRNDGTTSWGGESTKQSVINMQEAMKPATRNVRLIRHTSVPPFSGLTNLSFEDTKLLVGSTVQDKGFVSTSWHTGSNWGGMWELIIDAPEGTPLAYVEPVSYHKSEREVVLAGGTKFKILSVEQTSTASSFKTTVIHVRVVP